MIQILVADDHEVVRQGIRAVLEGHAGWNICGEAVTGREAIEQAKNLRPDVVILDFAMPELNGLEATRQIRRTVPNVKILALTVHDVDQLAEEFIEAGAHGYVLKADTGRTLVDAVNTILNGHMYFTSSLRAPDDEWTRAHAPQLPIKTLTKREREVLQLLAEGKSNKEIGTVLGISTKTAETHRTRLMAKLGVHSIAELVRYAIRNQIVEP